MKDHLGKIGLAGAIFAALCCIGTPALLTILSSIGAGFLINDSVLLPLLAFFLTLNIIGLRLTYRIHRNLWPMILGGLASAAIVVFIYGWFFRPGLYLGLGVVVANSVWNAVMKKGCETKRQHQGPGLFQSYEGGSR